MERRRVVVTGIGLVTPLGTGTEKTWQGLVNGRSGIGPITRFDASEHTTRIAGEVKDFDPGVFMDKKEARRMDLFTQYAVGAARMALEGSGLKIEPANAERVGVIVGSGIGGMTIFEETSTVFHDKGVRRISPFFVPQMIVNMASGQISILFGAKGPNWGTVSACATGAHGIGEGMRTIQYGDADVVIAGGTEASITPLGVGGFCAMRALSTRNDAPEKASRPFDRDRDGFVEAEGAGVLVLEELEFAKRRGAPILAELVGYGATADAYHITNPAPGGEGAARCMRKALADAGMAPADVGYINAHGTSTPPGDPSETQAIKSVFGDRAKKVAVSSTKSMTGHMLGAAGGVEAGISVLALQRGVLPPTINLENPDPACDLDYVPNQAREVKVDVSLSNSFGFGGTNTVLVFRRYRG
ncbi:MAG TPA: beta-ketoacyl-ACP synthase II [Myxococcales bacterium]|nr:beta-ketoacyl-ACP synthase II [Myxococcales bacterium]